MEVYLVRHGEATSEKEDPERPLSDTGSRDVSIVAEHMSTLNLSISIIYHSTKLRARQTAEIFNEKLKPKNGLKSVEGIAPKDDIRTAFRLIEDCKEPVMIVGHLPHLSKLLSALVTGEEENELVKFGSGSIVCLAKQNQHWIIKWSLSREVIPCEFT